MDMKMIVIADTHFCSNFKFYFYILLLVVVISYFQCCLMMYVRVMRYYEFYMNVLIRLKGYIMIFKGYTKE